MAIYRSISCELLADGALVTKTVSIRNAMNEVLRDAYVDDNQRGVDRWNKVIRDAGVDFELRLPHRRFNRKMGIHRGHPFDPDGNPIGEAEFEARRETWLPSEADKAYVMNLMQPVLERGKIAQWIAPPARGVNSQSFDVEYVRRV